MITIYEPGQVYIAEYPFLRSTYDEPGDSWKPGCESASNYDGDVYWRCDGVGSVVYTVIDTHKPAGYPTRVFYLRHWIDPNGRQFGRRRLQVATIQKFTNLIRGYHSPFTVHPMLARD